MRSQLSHSTRSASIMLRAGGLHHFPDRDLPLETGSWVFSSTVSGGDELDLGLETILTSGGSSSGAIELRAAVHAYAADANAKRLSKQLDEQYRGTERQLNASSPWH